MGPKKNKNKRGQKESLVAPSTSHEDTKKGTGPQVKKCKRKDSKRKVINDGHAGKNAEDGASASVPKREPVFKFKSQKFAVIKNETDHFVDKTELIEVVFKDSEAVVVTAPRAFGKSVNLNMLKEFVELKVYKGESVVFPPGLRLNIGQEIPRTKEYEDVFSKNLLLFRDESLYINRCQEIMDQHHGKYPVIYLDMKNITGDNFMKLMKNFRIAISEVFEEHSYLLKCEELWETERNETGFDKEAFNRFRKPKDVNEDDMEIDITYSLPFLAKILHTHFNHEVYVLIDEYDACINDSICETSIDIEKVNKLLNAFFKELLKSENSPVERAFLTGISYFATVGLSGARNIVKYMFLRGKHTNVRNEKYAKFYGLTENEVDSLIEKFQRDFWERHFLDANKVKSYYNGYRTLGNGKIKIFPIWSVLDALESKELTNAWEKSGIMVASRDAMKEPVVRHALEQLLKTDSTLEAYIPSTLELHHLQELREFVRKRQDKWYGDTTREILESAEVYLSFLVQQGYLVCSEIVGEPTDEKFKLQIPNDIIKKEIKNDIRQLYKPNYDNVLQQAVQAFHTLAESANRKSEVTEAVRGVIEALNEAFNYVSPKFLHTNEAAYQGVIFDVLCRTDFHSCIEVKGSKGRLDLAFKHHEIVFIIEVKYKGTTHEALNQIIERRYISTVQHKVPGLQEKDIFLMGLNVDKDHIVSMISWKYANQRSPTHVTLPKTEKLHSNTQ